MDGVTILNSFEVVIKSVFSWKSCLIGAIIGIVLVWIISLCVHASHGFDDWKAFWLTGLIMTPFVVIFLSVLLGFTAPKPVEYETHYEVLISEEVNMQEFMDRYEILETRGQIYTVRER